MLYNQMLYTRTMVEGLHLNVLQRSMHILNNKCAKKNSDLVT